jgi:hypothetical protein
MKMKITWHISGKYQMYQFVRLFVYMWLADKYLRKLITPNLISYQEFGRQKQNEKKEDRYYVRV